MNPIDPLPALSFNHRIYLNSIMKNLLSASLLLLAASCIPSAPEGETIDTGYLLREMTDLGRLSRLDGPAYRAMQFSSYDRRSRSRDAEGWFANSDGFGDEPIPGFTEVLREADSAGLGEYLICDVPGPGVVQRLWTAGLNGTVRVYLDNAAKPLYEGPAEDFFWKTTACLSGDDGHPDSAAFRQFDASYFPIAFARRFRMAWSGNIRQIHFYQVGLRLYEPGTRVQSFNRDDFERFGGEYREAIAGLNGNSEDSAGSAGTEILDISLPPDSAAVWVLSDGPKVIRHFSFRLEQGDPERLLRKCLLSLYFDGASVPQVQAPLGDFFGAAPGLNPFHSLPFSVQTDGTMICRFPMPFAREARIVLENRSGIAIGLTGKIDARPGEWVAGNTMHFTARWHMDHGLLASRERVVDIPYFVANGTGRLVGAAAHLFNPSEAVMSWGNWWGEGDEKIFVDRDSFPSFFGTGSEDYFNYSWSSERIFSHAYCGQPRNDGPGNRGFVSDYRWHIADDIPFEENIAFYMELLHHGEVPGFSYGRMVYAYALPGLNDWFQPVSEDDLRDIAVPAWEPLAYLGSAGYAFHQAESLLPAGSSAVTVPDDLASGGSLLRWRAAPGATLRFNLRVPAESGAARLGFTLAHQPGGGAFSVYLNGQPVLFGRQTAISTHADHRKVLRNHISGPVSLKKGSNEIRLDAGDASLDGVVDLDFFWIRAE
jgi:hypothetical protein